jgi:hypothetical protein
LSRRTNGDEAKGAFVEAVNMRGIQVLITAEMLENEQITIIPTASTLVRMDEFTMLVGAPYRIVLVDEVGDVDITDMSVTYAEMCDLRMKVDDAMGSEDDLRSAHAVVDAFLASKGAVWAGSVAPASDAVPDDSDDAIPLYDESVPAYAAYDDDDDSHYGAPVSSYADNDDSRYGAPASSYADNGFGSSRSDGVSRAEPEGAMSALPSDIADLPLYEGDDVPPLYEDDEELSANGDTGSTLAESSSNSADEPVVVFTEEDVREARRMVFHANGLSGDAIEIDDAQLELFLRDLDSVPQFDLSALSGEGWAVDKLRAMAMPYNAELQQLREQTLTFLRGFYLDSMNEFMEDIRRECDIDDPTTKLGKQRVLIEQWHDGRLSNIPSQVDDERRELEHNFERDADRAAEEAAAIARLDYVRTHRPRVDKERSEIEPRLRRVAENDYDTMMERLSASVIEQVKVRLEAASTVSLRNTIQEASRLMSQETELFERRRDDLNRFVLDMKSIEEQRIEATLRINDMTAHKRAALARMNSKMQDMQARLNASEAAHSHALAKLENDNKRALLSLEQQFASERSGLEETNRALRRENEVLRAQLDTISDTRDAHWKKQLDEINEDHTRTIAGMNQRAEEARRVNDRITSAWRIGVLLGLIVAILAGFVVGVFVSIGNRQSIDRAAIQQELDARAQQRQSDVR